MSQSAVISDPELRRPNMPAVSTSLEKLQELTRHGYLPDSKPLGDGDGILLRHSTAPDLILRADGTVDVPLAQPLKTPATPQPKPRGKRRWGRALLIFGFLLVYSLFSFVVIVAITG